MDDFERDHPGFDWKNIPAYKHPGGKDCPCPKHEYVREHTKAAEAFLASHTCQCILLDRKTCPVCGKKCHHDTPNRVKVMAGPV